MKYLFIICCLLFLNTVLDAQVEDLRQAKSLIIDKDTPVSINAQGRGEPSVPRLEGLSTWRRIDSMHNVFGMYLSEINPLAYDPHLDILTMIHRGCAASYAPSSGSMYYNWSTDLGLTWPRLGPFNDVPEPLGRYPSGVIFDPRNDIAETYAVGVFPNLDPTTWGGIGYGCDYPIGEGTFVYMSESGDTTPGSPNFGLHGANMSAWTSKNTVFWVSGLNDGSIFIGNRLYRTSNFSLIHKGIPPAWDTTKVINNVCDLGGDAIRVGGTWKIAFAHIGHFYRVYRDMDSILLRSIGVSYSIDEGATWSLMDTVNLLQVPGIGEYRRIWTTTGSNFRVMGRMVLDSLGYPHIVTGLQKNWTGAGTDVVFAEIYKDAEGWKGKIIAGGNPSTSFADQSGYCAYIARNKEGTVFAAQFTTSPYANNNPDIFLSVRRWTSINWRAPVNITQTPLFTQPFEAINHMAPRIRHVSGNIYTVYSAYADPTDRVSWDASPNRTYIMFGSNNVDATPINYDYAALGTVYPTPAASYTPDSSFTNMKASFKNMGEMAQTEAFDVTYRILRGNTVLFTNTKNITTGLGLDQMITVTFDGTFPSPPGLLDTGVYTLQCIVYAAGDQIRANDTAISSMTIVNRSAITYSTVNKIYRPYEEITGGIEIPAVDDTSIAFELPFTFVYDGVSYDSVQFSTNSWVEFGKAGFRRDSLPYGLSTPDNIHYNQNGRLFSTARPRKVISAWWEDLWPRKGLDPTASVSYKVEGTAPNRVLVFQWKNCQAYYDTQTTAKVNLQVRLYEKTNLIEFCYGAQPTGTFAGTDTGAMIGLKDHVGGDYRYFDVAKYYRTGNPTGQRGEGMTLLNPLYDWPGADSVYQIRTTTMTTYRVNLAAKWNLVSVGVTRTNYAVTSVYPTAIPGTTYDYTTGTYQPRTSYELGKGYWTKFPLARIETVVGTPLPSINIELRPGWNLIGSVDHEIPAPAVGGIIASSTFGYSNGYVVVNKIKPGRAYWIKANAAGNLPLGTVLAKEDADNIADNTSFNFVDKAGGSVTLYLKDNTDGNVNLEHYEMPPLPPQNAFDIRFGSNRILEGYSNNEENVYPINLQAVEYPLTVHYHIKDQTKGALLEEVDANDKVIATHSMYGEGRVTVANGAVTLRLRVIEGKPLPKEFALGQNYPNPFNPITRMSVEMPKDAHLEVIVYDILGRKVATLFDGEQKAGYHTIVWNAQNDQNMPVPSGIYFIRMVSDKFSAVRKVMLLK